MAASGAWSCGGGAERESCWACRRLIEQGGRLCGWSSLARHWSGLFSVDVVVDQPIVSTSGGNDMGQRPGTPMVARSVIP